MQFFAHLKEGSEIYRRWRSEHRTRGELHGVIFLWDGKSFVSKDRVPEDKIDLLNHVASVQLELAGVITDPIRMTEVAPVTTEPAVPVNPPSDETDMESLLGTPPPTIAPEQPIKRGPGRPRKVQ